jgi:hypothetical protein
MLAPTPTTTDGTPKASNVIIARSASTRVEYVLIVFIDIALRNLEEFLTEKVSARAPIKARNG